jgi:hypothetical protein
MSSTKCVAPCEVRPLSGLAGAGSEAQQPELNAEAKPKKASFCEVLTHLDLYDGQEVEFSALLIVMYHGTALYPLNETCQGAMSAGDRRGRAVMAFNSDVAPVDEEAAKRINQMWELLRRFTKGRPNRILEVPFKVRGVIQVAPKDPAEWGGYRGFGLRKDIPVMVRIKDIEEIREP